MMNRSRVPLPGRAFPILSPGFLLLGLLLISACGAREEGSDGMTIPLSDADRVANRVMEALGGQEAWERTRFIRFTFAGARTHYWDRQTGRHRLEFADRQDAEKRIVVLSNIETREGSAFVNGEGLEGDEKAGRLDGAYRAWVNDTYWLLMPYKLKDPGVNLEYEGEEMVDGRMCDVLKLSFEGVGLTPGDRYWAYIDRETGLMDRWAYILQNQDPDGPKTTWMWQGWARHGDIMLAPSRIRPEDGRELPLDNIAVYNALPETVFTSPEPTGL